MKLKRLQVAQFKQYREPVTLDQFDDRITLIHGPNEAGKSTLVQALRAAFFERHNTSAARELQPWGDSGASPTVEIDLVHQGQTIKIKKRFMKQGRCDLQIDGQSFTGEEAEAHLASWLGYEYPGRGASKPEHWGVPGLLWVEQGTGQELAAAVANAQDHLEGALDSLLGEVASSGGDALIDAVRAQRAALLTDSGKPRGELKESLVQREQAHSELTALQYAVGVYQSDVDQLGRLQCDQAEDEANRPWENAEAERAKAQKKYDAIRTRRDEETALISRLDELKVQAELTAQQLTRHRAVEQALRARQEARTDAEYRLEALSKGGDGIAAQVSEAAAVLDRARTQHRLAGQWRHRQHLSQQLAHYETLVEQQQAALTQAREQKEALSALRTELSGLTVTEEALRSLETIEQSLQTLRIRKEAIATRLSWTLPENQTLALHTDSAEESLRGQDERLLLSPTTLALSGGGRLTITPGGEDASHLRDQLATQESELTECLQSLGVETIDAARRVARDRDRLQSEINLQAGLLAQKAPEGIEALAASYQEIRRQRDQYRQQLDELPALPEGFDFDNLPEPAEASAALEHAENRLKVAETAYRDHERQREDARIKFESAEREWQYQQQEVQSEGYRTMERQLSDQAAKHHAAIQECERALAACRKAIAAAQPELLQQDIERYQKIAETLRKQFREREIEIHRLQSSLQTRGAEGLDEAFAMQKSAVEQFERRVEELQLQADALDLLYNLLSDQRQALIARLQAPLQQRLDHYLNMLFPQAHLAVNESLLPEQFSRNDTLGKLQELSFGAREQLGLISRLAYADLLRDAGKPTLIILDDSLVHSDTERLDAMNRVLYDASNRHQILLLTCHPERYQYLGATPVDLQNVKARAS